MGSVPGTNSCSFTDVVTVVPSQAAACDTAGVIKRKQPALSPFSHASFLSFVMYPGSSLGVDRCMYHFTFSSLIESTERPQTMHPV